MNTTRKALDLQSMFAALTLTKDPFLWLIGPVVTLLGLAAPEVTPSAQHALLFGLLAFLGGLLGKLFEIYLKIRQQRAKEREDEVARMERLLKEERVDHRTEIDRHLHRIETLEAALVNQKRPKV